MVKVITIMDDVYSELYRLKKSKDIAFQALLLDPTIENATKAEEMFIEMLRVNKDVINLK